MTTTAEERAARQRADRAKLIQQGRCPGCGWRTAVSGPGLTCASCVRKGVRP